MKPAGIFATSPGAARPSWETFALLVDWQDFPAAVADARATGRWWVLYLGSPDPHADAATWLPALVARIDAAGLRPYLVGVVYHEEWSGAFLSGSLAIPGMNYRDRAHWQPAAEIIAWWCGMQHAAIRAALPGLSIVWLDGFVNDDLSFGPWWYRPVPAGVDVLALYGYVPAGGSWAADVEPFLLHAVGTRTEPLALVVQGFRELTGMWAAGPTVDGLAGTARWMRHPRVIASWVFDWTSRPGFLVGMQDLPQRAALEAAIGVGA